MFLYERIKLILNSKNEEENHIIVSNEIYKKNQEKDKIKYEFHFFIDQYLTNFLTKGLKEVIHCHP